jgi:hypothetical protein
MQRNTLIVLFLLALGLGAYVYFYEIKGEDARQAAADAEKQLFKVSKDDVSSLQIQNSHGTFTLTRQDGKWSLTEPTAAPADARAAEDLIYGLDAIRYSRIIDEKPSDLAQFGLATPRFRVTYTTREGEKSLLVGDDAQVGGETYIKRGDTPTVYLTSYPLKDKIDKDLLGWRDKRILDFVVADVKRITVQGPGFAGLEAVKQDETWSAPAAGNLRLDNSQLETMLYDLQGMNTVSFTGIKDPAPFGLEPPALTVTLEVGNDKTHKQVMFGAPYGEEGRLPVIREPGEEVRLVDPAIKAKLEKTPQDLRDKRLSNVQRFKVEKLEAKLGDQTLTATRDKESWKLEGTLKDKVKPSDVEAILDDVSGLKSEKPIDGVAPADLGKYGLDKPALELTLTETGAPKPTVLMFAHPPDNAKQTVARVEGDPTVYELTQYVLDDMKDVLLKTKKETSPEAAGVGTGASDATGAGSGASLASPGAGQAAEGAGSAP